jgi:hypothetical protein
MKRMKPLSLAWVIGFLVACCKPDTPAPQAAKVTEDVQENATEPEQGVDPSARRGAERFLWALKTADSPAGRKTIAETRWRRTMKFPEFQELTLLSEEMFSTDVPGVRGYKRVVKLTVPREGRSPLVKKYMLVAYEDRKESAWKIFDFTEAAHATGEAERACEEKALAGDLPSTRQRRHVRCSYWLLLAGKITEAESMVRRANVLYAENPDPDDAARYYKTRADATLEMISRMTGEQT